MNVISYKTGEVLCTSTEKTGAIDRYLEGKREEFRSGFMAAMKNDSGDFDCPSNNRMFQLGWRAFRQNNWKR